ncbi:MAG: hypothetical protein Q4E75_04995 [bacterium]|nr:hypothetical protein [bacterium]
MGYFLYLQSNILNFFNNYLTSNINVVGENIRDNLINGFIYIIPIVVIFISIIIFGIMFKKNKPVIFYFITIIFNIFILVVNFYTSNLLNTMEQVIVSIRIIKLIHDFVLISMILSGIIIIFFIIRGMGLNLKKFDFDSDITKLEISEEDKEEFEVNVDFDLDNKKANFRTKLRNYKYFYLENKFIINILLSIVIFIIIILIIFLLRNNLKSEGVFYDVNNVNIKINKTHIINEDYKGNKLTKDNLIVLEIYLGSNNSNYEIRLDEFNLKIDNLYLKPTLKYSNLILDIGTCYNENTLTLNPKKYLLTFEVKEKYMKSDMILKYNDLEIKLDPKKITNSKKNISKTLGEVINFENDLSDISFKINSFDIKDKVVVSYDYCIKEDDCINSKEYIIPKLDQNYDKYVLTLDIDYNYTNSNYKKFYELLSYFGYIYYCKNEICYKQESGFEELKSNKKNSKNIEYIGINSDVFNSDNIKFIFDIRGLKYEYIIK